jgi:hypothetical protein
MLQTPYALTIDGQRVFSAETVQAINPATEQPICTFPLIAARTPSMQAGNVTPTCCFRY